MPEPLHVGSGALFAQLPAPSMTATGSSSLLGNLPAPKAAARRRQPIKLASSLTPLPDSDDEVCTAACRHAVAKHIAVALPIVLLAAAILLHDWTLQLALACFLPAVACRGRGCGMHPPAQLQQASPHPLFASKLALPACAGGEACKEGQGVQREGVLPDRHSAAPTER